MSTTRASGRHPAAGARRSDQSTGRKPGDRSAGWRPRLRRCTRALSLVEALIAIPIVGISLVAALNTVGAARLTEQKSLQRQRAYELAESLLGEMASLPYDDALDLSGPIGPSPQELATGNRSLFNDINDYDGWKASPPQRKDGSPIPDGGGWRESVSIERLDPGTWAPTGGADLGLTRITVNVLYGDAPLAALTALRTRALPELEACCLPDRSCRNLPKPDCQAYGGTAKGNDTTCWTTYCTGAGAHWKMDEGSGMVATDSAGGHNATLFGPTWTAGKYGQALEFKIAYASVPHHDALSLTNQLTIGAWVKKWTRSGFDTIFFKGRFGSVNYYFDTYYDEVLFGFYDGGWRDFVTPAVNMQRNRWYHVAATYNAVGRTVKIYVDGALVYSSTLADQDGTGPLVPLPPNTESATIGQSIYLNEYFDGIIDDLRIYDVALDASGIIAIMNGQDPQLPSVSPEAQ